MLCRAISRRGAAARTEARNLHQHGPLIGQPHHLAPTHRQREQPQHRARAKGLHRRDRPGFSSERGARGAVGGGDHALVVHHQQGCTDRVGQGLQEVRTLLPLARVAARRSSAPWIAAPRSESPAGGVGRSYPSAVRPSTNWANTRSAARVLRNRSSATSSTTSRSTSAVA
jgi:hypothetical protein